MEGSVSASLELKLQWLVEDLKKYQPEKIILFGSAARGEMDAYSDLDVVLIKKTTAPFVQRGVDAIKLLRQELFHVQLFVYTPEEFERMSAEENPLIERVLTEGKVLYEKAA